MLMQESSLKLAACYIVTGYDNSERNNGNPSSTDGVNGMGNDKSFSPLPGLGCTGSFSPSTTL
jgi:hypothetical protein